MLLGLHDPTSQTAWLISAWLCVLLFRLFFSPVSSLCVAVFCYLISKSCFWSCFRNLASICSWLHFIFFCLALTLFVLMSFFSISLFPSYLDFTQSCAQKINMFYLTDSARASPPAVFLWYLLFLLSYFTLHLSSFLITTWNPSSLFFKSILKTSLISFVF